MSPPSSWITEAGADAGFFWSNIAAIVGAAFALLGVLGSFYFGGIRDRYAAAALANERTQRQALEARVRSRHLSNQQRDLIISEVRALGWKQVEIIWHGSGEPESYARDLASAFEQGGATVKVHTLDPFIPYAWGLLVVKTTTNDDSSALKAILDKAGVASSIALTNETVGQKDHPTLLVGTPEDLRTPGTQ